MCVDALNILRDTHSRRLLLSPALCNPSTVSLISHRHLQGACKAVLAKGYGFKIADCCDTVPDHFTCGLAWDVTDGVNIDLDASAIMLGSNLSLKDIVFFGKLQVNG